MCTPDHREEAGISISCLSDAYVCLLMAVRCSFASQVIAAGTNCKVEFVAVNVVKFLTQRLLAILKAIT